jgi:Arc/MetJ-type ribon-helix-helix transcriptional regulator
METISLKMDKSLLTEIDTTIKKRRFSTRTEFIRSAIREKLDGMSREELIQAFLSLRGKGKPRLSEEEFEKMRERSFYELAKEKSIKLD